MTSTIGSGPSRCGQAFFWALCMGAALFLPFVIFDGGYFIYYGDFNVQQIPFYQLAHEAVRSGDIFWSWHTDLGANFIGSYSFYLLFSPFFWLTLPFPTHFLPYLMAPLLVLKPACAALTACLYLERFVRDKRFAVAGSLLYAFSGWMLFNVFFNHFHEVAVFFPLLLWGLERLVCEDKRGVFAVAVAVNAMVNYWFFVGEVVFVILYVVIRACTGGWRMTPRKFLRVCWESVLGVGMAALVLAPSVAALMGNPRTGLSELVSGWGIWLYWHEQRQPAILQSLLFPPDLPARPNFFPDHGAKWSSLSGWLPMLGLTGVLAYFFERKNDWVKRMLALCLVIALVPGLNSLFILLNNSYYARWFYMPILLMSLATARALEDSVYSTASFRRAIKWSAILVVAFTIMSGLTPNEVEGEWVLGMAAYPDMLWGSAITAGACLALTAYVVVHRRRRRWFMGTLLGGIAVASVAFGIYYMAHGKDNAQRSQFIIDTAIGGREQIQLPDTPFARADVYDDMGNIAMFWHLPNIQAFHSIVPPSIMEFYPTVGVKRDVSSHPEADYYALRPLLSVRWLFIHQEKEEQKPMPGYVKYSEANGFNIYENLHYIPMGFGYDQFITADQLEDVETGKRSNLMLRAVVLSEDAAYRHRDILSQMDTVTRRLRLDADQMAQDAADRRVQAAYAFETDTRGFTAYTDLSRETLVFFSVPGEQGWSARVNGQPARIEQANIGFMAVRVPAGEARIRFEYRTPWLREGIYISLGTLGIFLVYLFAAALVPLMRKKGDADSFPEQLLTEGLTPRRLSLDQYLSRYGDRKARAIRLQRRLNEASARSLPDALPQSDRTLPFKPPEDDNTSLE